MIIRWKLSVICLDKQECYMMLACMLLLLKMLEHSGAHFSSLALIVHESCSRPEATFKIHQHEDEEIAERTNARANDLQVFVKERIEDNGAVRTREERKRHGVKDEEK